MGLSFMLWDLPPDIDFFLSLCGLAGWIYVFVTWRRSGSS